MPNITLSILDIILLVFFAIILGITIHFFITSRRSLKSTFTEPKKNEQDLNEWKMKYFNDVEIKDKELSSLRQQLEEAEENSKIYLIEAEESKKQNKKLQQELEAARKATPQLSHGSHTDKMNYYEQLRQAQNSLMEHNEKINQLLSNIDIIKETEEKQKEILKDNEELYNQIEDLRSMLSQKEQEINNTRQKAHLSKEMTSMLDNAYLEFNTLQEKIQKLESQVSSSKNINLEYEDLKEEHIKMSRDFEEQRTKLNALSSENRELQALLAETEDKFKDAHFHRQQLQKRVAYLEELNNDLQAVSDANKRLESQIKRIGELESMLNVVAEERDKLMRKG
jgi:DNA repair exonuclease SbcCD ATPase subunit